MRVLMVSQAVPYLPCHDGFRLIPANLLRNLFNRHEFHLIALSCCGESEDQARWPRDYCKSVSSISIGTRNPREGARDERHGRFSSDSTRSTIRQRRFVRIYYISKAVGWQHCFARLRWRILESSACMTRRRCATGNSPGTPSVQRERIRFYLLSLLARREERRWFGYADRVVVTSPSDAAALSGALNADRIAVIPNGVDLDHSRIRRPRPGASYLPAT